MIGNLTAAYLPKPIDQDTDIMPHDDIVLDQEIGSRGIDADTVPYFIIALNQVGLSVRADDLEAGEGRCGFHRDHRAACGSRSDS